MRGEYKVAGGKLVAVDVEVEGGAISRAFLSGDFFLEPDSALDDVNGALLGMPADSSVEDMARAIEAATPGVEFIGFTPEAERRAEPVALPPTVIDADALNALAELDGWWEGLGGPAILTPHPGEMARLMRRSTEEIQRDRLGAAREAARQWGQVVVLKGAYTVVATPEGRVTVIPFANAALATAGTGDVLAGAIVGLLAQGLSPRDAAVCGAYLHGLAADLWARQGARAGMVAGDLLPLLPHALAALA